MKKSSKIITVVIFMIMFVLTVPVFKSYALGINVTIDGKQVNFTQDSGVPFIDSASRTQVPLRVTMEAYGCAVSWNNISKTATIEKEGTIVQVPVGASFIIVNGANVQNDTVAQIKNGRVYLPIRSVLEAFGASVNWKSTTNYSEISCISPDYKYQSSAGYDNLFTVSPTSLNLKVGETTTVTITTTKEVASDVHAHSEWANTNVIDVFCPDVWYGNSVDFAITGLTSGETTISFSLEEYPSYVIKVPVTVKEGPISSSINFYKFPGVPDFGAMAKINPVLINEQSYAYYTSDVSDQNIRDYSDLLLTKGFIHIGSFVSENGNTVICYRNPALGLTVMTGVEAKDNVGYYVVMVLYDSERLL